MASCTLCLPYKKQMLHVDVACLTECKSLLIFVLCFGVCFCRGTKLWWFHPEGRLNSTTAVLFLLLKGRGAENTVEKGSRAEIRTERSLSNCCYRQQTPLTKGSTAIKRSCFFHRWVLWEIFLCIHSPHLIAYSSCAASRTHIEPTGISLLCLYCSTASRYLLALAFLGTR